MLSEDIWGEINRIKVAPAPILRPVRSRIHFIWSLLSTLNTRRRNSVYRAICIAFIVKLCYVQIFACNSLLLYILKPTLSANRKCQILLDPCLRFEINGIMLLMTDWLRNRRVVGISLLIIGNEVVQTGSRRYWSSSCRCHQAGNRHWIPSPGRRRGSHTRK